MKNLKAENSGRPVFREARKTTRGARVLPVILGAAILILSLRLFAQPFHIHYPPSPGEGTNFIQQYLIYWNYTNSGAGSLFATAPAGVTNVAIPQSVPSPSYLLVLAQGTNGTLSTNLNWTRYDTGVLSNTPVPIPVQPGTSIVLTNN